MRTFSPSKSCRQMQMLLDLRGNITIFIHVTDSKMHKVNVLDILIPEAGSFYIMDRGSTDFARWFTLRQPQAFFVIRGNSNLPFRRVYSSPADKSKGLNAPKASKDYQHTYDAPCSTMPKHDRHLIFLTDNFDLAALTHRSPLSLPLTGRTILQMDQTAPSDHAVLWHYRNVV